MSIANRKYAPGGGLCGVIFRSAGKELKRVCSAIPEGIPGQCVITKGMPVYLAILKYHHIRLMILTYLTYPTPHWPFFTNSFTNSNNVAIISKKHTWG